MVEEDTVYVFYVHIFWIFQFLDILDIEKVRFRFSGKFSVSFGSCT